MKKTPKKHAKQSTVQSSCAFHSFKDALKFAASKGIKPSRYLKAAATGKPSDAKRTPHRSFDAARMAARRLGLRSAADWKAFCAAPAS